jgi:hypothetical protein
MFTENKIMKLNYNSTSAKLYRWFYGEESMPSNLCPYFWKLVVAYFFALPLALFTLPMIIGKGHLSSTNIGHRLGISVVMWLIVFFGISMIAGILALFVPPDPEKNILYMFMTAVGLTTWLFAIVIGSIQGLELLYKAWRQWRWDAKWKREYNLTEKKPNLIIEMAKAKYNKYCPKIDWNK